MPSAEAVQMVLAAVPGVAAAEVRASGESQGTMSIRVADGFDPRTVAEQVSSVLRERFSIDVPPAALVQEPAQPAPTTESSRSASRQGDTVVLYDASRSAQPDASVVGVDLPGWDAVLVRAQESAARVASGAALATAAHAIRTGPNPAASAAPMLTAVPEPVEEEHDLLTQAAMTVGSLHSSVDPSELRVVDAGIEGVGDGRRAIVVVSRQGRGDEAMAIGAALVGAGSDATAVANATLAAIRDLG